MKTVRQICEAHGGQMETARILKVDARNVRRWVELDKMPDRYLEQLGYVRTFEKKDGPHNEQN